MIYTVFPKDEDLIPQDFSTYKEAKEYAEYVRDTWNSDSEIQSTEGEII